MHPWFDLWTLVTPALGYGDGVLCTTVLPAGLGGRLESHPMIPLLAPGAQVYAAGKVYPPPPAAVEAAGASAAAL